MSLMNGKNLFDVSGKVVLITGAGSGLGEGYALAFGEAGSTVICAGRNQSRLDNTVRQIRENGGSAQAYTVDVTDLDSIKAMVAAVTADHGRIDVLVNNAGYEHIQPFTEVTPQVYDDIMNVNMKGVFFVAQEVAKVMKEHGGGKIINIGSLGSFIGLAESSVYCSTKGGVIQLSKTMAIELGPFNIQVNCLAPGVVLTDIDNAQAQGQVKLEAMEWTARSTSGEIIPAGAKIRVDRIEGVKVFVSVIEVPAAV